MYTRFFVLIFVFHNYHVKGISICESSCACKYEKEQDFFGETIDCAYSDPLILKSNYTLPNVVFLLDLSSTNLTRVQSSKLFQSNTMLQLYLNKNEITEIETNALQLPELKRLDVSDNRLEFIDENIFKNIKKLEYLNLANNKFTTFSKLTFHRLNSLREIIFDNNVLGPSVQEFDLFNRNGFALAHTIQVLSISGINLNQVPENFFIEAYDLKKLTISNNNLTDIFEIPFTLEYLDLSDNPIEEISSEDFSDLPALMTLKLNNLHIKEIPDFVFAPMKGLLELELERNRNLTKFSVWAFGQEVLDDSDDFILEKLSIRGSRVSTLDKQLAMPFGQLLHLDLQGNPWRCDCNLLWLKSLQIPPEDYEYLRCGTPRSLFNSRIFDLEDEYLSCPMNKRYTGLAIAAMALVIILTTMALWLFLFLPRYQSRCNFIQNIYPSTVYSVLPLSHNRNDF